MILSHFAGTCMYFRRTSDRNKRGSMAGGSPLFPALAGIGLLLVSSGAWAQTLEQTLRQSLSGRYDTVIETARKKAEAGEYIDGWRVLLVKSLLTVGRSAEAHTNALAGVNDFPGSIDRKSTRLNSSHLGIS